MDRLIYPNIPDFKNIQEGLREIIDSKNVTNGRYVSLVEDKLKEMHGCKYVLATGSGVMAFLLLLKSIPRSFDKIYMQDFTWEGTKVIVESLFPGIVEYIDVDKNTLLCDEPEFDSGLFIPTMTFGNIKTYKYENTIYDSASCAGMRECNGRGFGEILSFSPTKNLTAMEGGAILTNNKEIYERAKSLRKILGRMSEINALILLNNLSNFDKILARKKEIYENYESNLNSNYKLQAIPLTSSYNEINLIVLGDRNKVIEELSKYVEIRIRYRPSEELNENSVDIYNTSLVIPSSPQHDVDNYIKILNSLS